MTFSSFYRGFLYALREEVGESGRFVAEGDKFHEAFREALTVALRELPEVPVRQMLRNFDPVFGVSPEATEMVLEGERDFIVSLLNPRLRIAQFKIDTKTAREQLEQMPEREALRRVAQRFHERLAS